MGFMSGDGYEFHEIVGEENMDSMRLVGDLFTCTGAKMLFASFATFEYKLNEQ